MDTTRENHYEKNLRTTSVEKKETSSSDSSDSYQTPSSKKSPQKKRKGKKTSKQLFTPDYFPMYTPPWATMNYVYLDLLRQLSMESEIRSSLTKLDKKYDYAYSKDLQAKKMFMEDEQCCDRRKMKHKLFSCEDFETPCSHLCLSCHQKIKCSSCGQTILQKRAPETAQQKIKPLTHYCNCTYDSCPALLDLQHIPSSCCSYHFQKVHPHHHFVSHQVCGSLDHVSVDNPVREVHEPYKSTRRAQHSLNSEAGNKSDSTLEEKVGENCLSINDNNISKDQPVLESQNEDMKKQDFEDDHTTVPSFLGGTGDEGSKLQVKRTRKSRLPQSTAYFLPINCLTTKYISPT